MSILIKNEIGPFDLIELVTTFLASALIQVCPQDFDADCYCCSLAL